MKAYIQVSVEPGNTRKVLSDCLKVPGVVEGHVVLGPFDVMLELEQASVSELMQTVEQKLHNITGIQRTSTVICFEAGMWWFFKS